MGWSCSACTYSNASMASQACEMCGTARPQQQAAPVVKAKAAAAPEGWACRQCTFVNVRSATRCAICEAAGADDAMMIDDEKTRPSPSRLDAIDLTKASLAPAPKRTPENVMKLPSEAEASRKLAGAQARDRERLQQELSLKAKLKEERMRQRTERMAELEREKLELAKKKDAERLESTKQLFDMVEKHQEEIRLARERRNQVDQTLGDIPSAIRHLHEQYGMETVKDVLLVVSKIVLNIIESPQEAKFRTISTSSASFKNRIESRLGGTALMKLLGFQYQQKEDELGKKHEILFMQSPNLPFLQAEYEKMVALLTRPETRLHTYLPAASDNEDVPIRFLLDFRRILDNVAAAPTSSLAGKIDVRSDSYKAFFVPFAPSESILKEFNFEQSDHFWTWKGKNVSQLQKGVRDLDKEIAKRLPNCSIAKTLLYVNAHNPRSVTTSLITKLQTVLNNVINDMHQTRHHVVPLQPLLKLTGPIDGLSQLLTSTAFVVDPEVKFARVPYPYKFGIEPYRLALEIVDRIWSRIMKSAK